MKLIFWLRSALVMLVIFPLITLGLSLTSIPWTILTKDRRYIDWCAQQWGAWTIQLFSIQLNVKGLENLPSTSCLFLFNHGSFLDVFALAALIPKLKFGAKIELYQIPVFGSAMRAAGMLPIARKNREEVIRIYKAAKIRTDQGEQFALAPEGSRHTDQGIGPFKSGPFIFAIECEIPIVPVVITGAKEVWPKGSLIPCSQSWTTEIGVQFLNSVSTKGLTLDDRSDLSARVRQEMIKFYS